MNKVSERILADARERVAGIAAQYDEKERLLLDEHEADMRTRRERRDRELQALRLAELRRHEAERNIERSKRILAAKWRILDQLLEEVRGRFAADQGLYDRFMERALLACDPPENSEILVSTEDRERLDGPFLAAMNGRLSEMTGRRWSVRLAEETRKTGGGFYLQESRVEINATLDTVIGKAFDDNLPEIARLLFGGGAGEGKP
ncbi:MAG: hypothetical protein JXA20_10250 [Spirochaetes bacterium]|nr:hypothetical protein [Spirochaetota bacterium]